MHGVSNDTDDDVCVNCSSRVAISAQVRLVASFSDAQRSALLAAAACVLYTPENEHFGIVPLEAMAAGRPVVACDSGGPKETVVDGTTGFLCPPEPAAFAAAMARLAVRLLGLQAFPEVHTCCSHCLCNG